MSNSSEPIPTLAVTPGEPAGIGPDVVLAIVAGGAAEANLLIVADPDMMAERARLLGFDISVNDYSVCREFVAGALNVWPVELGVQITPGRLDVATARYVIRSLEEAVTLCEQGVCAAMVTGPVHKAVINESGIPFSGHTEWLQARTGADDVVMLLATEGLMVALATTHLPLRQVPDAITATGLLSTIRTLHGALRKYFALEHPRLLVLGLNPHAGESGHLGTEEVDTITPVLDGLRAEGMALSGPVPADTAFSASLLGAHDAVLAMYHDQGLPVLKFAGFGAAANITLGLPLIRTSVDHGTALDLAGTGEANPGGMRTAIRYALTMARRRSHARA